MPLPITDVFADLPDPRSEVNRRHHLIDILTIAPCAVILGAVGLTPDWGHTMLKRWYAHGPDGLADGRKGNETQSVLTPAQQADLYAAVQADPPDGGLWYSGPRK